jgi:hypothetical protein
MPEGDYTFPRNYAAFLIIALTIAAGDVMGQTKSEIKIPDSTEIQIVTLKDGSVIVGRTTSVSDSVIVFRAEMGEINIPISKIKEIREEPLSAMKKGSYWFPNPNATRLFFAPTGWMLKKGQGYFCDYYLFFPGFSYGITDNISLGGGVSIFPGLSMSNQAYFFTPKIGLATSPKTELSLGALIISIPVEIDDVHIPTFGVLYGVGSYGSPDGSVSAGLGYGFAGSRFAPKPVAMIGGEKRLSRRISLLTENWVLPGVDNPIISYGARFFGENISVDLGFFSGTGPNFFFPGIPWIDFVFNFR